MEAQIPLKEPRPKPREMPIRLSDKPLSRSAEHGLRASDAGDGAAGYVWLVDGKRVVELEIRFSDFGLLIWDCHHVHCYDTGHRFKFPPNADELLEFVRRHAVKLMAPLLAREAATASSWQD